MNFLERQVYDLVKRNPDLKNSLVDLYQRLFYLWPAGQKRPGPGLIVREGFFFGFHDKCPWSVDQTRLLAHRARIENRMPRPHEPVDIGYFAAPDYASFTSIASSRAWNWQQGSMLQWLGPSGHLVFNDCDGAKLVARVVDSTGRRTALLPRPVAAVSADGRWALSYSFERMRHVARAYAYANGSDAEDDDPQSARDGLFLLDVAANKVQKLFTIADLAAAQPDETMSGAYHYLTHCLFNRSGSRFLFLHRWVRGGRTWTRLVSSDLGGDRRHIFPTNGMVSHFCWRDDRHVLAYASTAAAGDRYHLFEDESERFATIGDDFFRADGHPQFSPNGAWLLTDSYPDRSRLQSLFVYDMDRQSGTTLARLKIPLRYRYDVRCDFHPRWSRDGRWICFDSAHTGRRALCTLEWTGLDHQPSS
jgi:hypothetical protein